MTVIYHLQCSKFIPVLLLFSVFNLLNSTVTQTPSLACEGDTITVSCVLTPPIGDTFTSVVPDFIVGDSNAELTINDINTNIVHPNVSLSRLTASVSSGTTTRVSAEITLNSYLTSDEGLRLGCYIEIFAGGTANNLILTETLRLTQATPFAPSLQSSVSNFNTATCSADISLSWNTPPSDRTVDRYFLYLDGSPLATTNSNSYLHSTILNINTDYQYSVTAMSCAGNSTNSSSTVSVASYSLLRSSQHVCVTYSNVTGGLTINWRLSTLTQPSELSGLHITYSLQLLYSHSRQGITHTYTDSTSFTLPSSQLSYNTVLTAHNFTQLDGVETNITADLTIVQQCGQSFSGRAMECFFTSNNPLTPPSSTPLPVSAALPSSITPMNNLTDTTTTAILSTALPYTNSFPSCLPISITIALVLFISLVINLLLITVVIFLLRKITHLNSALTPSKPAPSHPYEYIDLDKMSDNISSPTQQQSPQDYVPMSSVSKQDTTQPPTHYANLNSDSKNEVCLIFFPRFLIGNFSGSLTANNINTSISHTDVDLSRLTAYTNAGSDTMVSGVVTLLSYLTSDEGLRIGCKVSLNIGMDLIENIQLIQAALPSLFSLQSSVSNFNTATCSADISLSWNTPPSNKTVDRYFLYLDGSPLATTNSNSHIHSTILNINTDYQYSVTAMSCAGNSTISSANVNSVASYSLMRSSQPECLVYDKVTRRLTVNWELSAPTQPSGVSGLNITYSLQLLYSHSRQGVTYTYANSTNFTLPSSQFSYNTVLTAHNFTQLEGVETNITANLMIVRQCGQSFNGTVMECFLNSNYPAILPTSSIPTSTEMSSSYTSIQMITTTVPSNTVSINSCSTLLPTSIILALLFLISLVVNLTLIIIVILLLIRNKQSKSPSIPAPSHPYEYVDLDKLSGNISSPTQQQSPQDYVPMSSISKQDTTQPPTHYANLK